LDRLLASNYDAGIGPFKLSLRRREARDLRKGIFGPRGSRVVPKFSGDLDEYDGVMEFDLPKGWRLRLNYYPAHAYDFVRRKANAGLVDAGFIPPRAQRRPGGSQDGTSLAA
jgi:hypothetical protein